MNNNKPGFFDKNTLLAIGLSFAVFFLWQQYVAKKYPNKKLPTVTQAADPQPGLESTGPQTKSEDAVKPGTPGPAAPDTKTPVAAGGDFKAQTLGYDSEYISFDLSSDGMGLKTLVLKKFTDRKNGPVTYTQNEFLPLAATSVNDVRNFQITKVSENEFAGQLMVDGVQVIKTIVVDPKYYTLHTTIQVSAPEKKIVRLKTFIQGTVDEVSSSFLLPSYEHQEFFVLNTEDKHRQKLDPTKNHKEAFENGQIAAFNSQYFALALMNRSELLPKVSTDTEGKKGGLFFFYETPQPIDAQVFKYEFYFGPKHMDTLKAVDEQLTLLVDYGFFSFIGKPLLWVMKFLHSFVSNWGIAIILLTMLIRTVLLPMNFYSFKSMRKMQKIQPKLAAIKEKYKNDPARINQETLQLMRTEKANPLSGCIPALLQIPIFLALYPMIGNSFELYKEPFYFWIHDLTLKDPFYVLPVLGGLVFFIQQKLTPTPNMDPAQQKMLMIMPLFFSLFMLSAPSGLSLYVFINSLYGFFQQMVFMKEKTRTT